MIIYAPISLGELCDKITILQIKMDRIADAAKQSNVRTELDLLTGILHAQPIGTDPVLLEAMVALRAVNERIWDAETLFRRIPATEADTAAFAAAARRTYADNDRRAQIKREINLRFGSHIVEEKYHGT